MRQLASDSKEAIVAAAMELFVQKDYDSVTVKEICDKAMIPRSSFYLKFSDKADILAYQLENVKANFHQNMYEFISAGNDFERIWFLTDAYLKQAADFGPALCKAYFILELNNSIGLFRIIEDFNDWLIQLTVNCQKQGIIHNQTEAKYLVPMQLNIAKATLFDWVCANGSFPLRKSVRKSIELFLDVSPDYRQE